jgi:hypothetical protein
LGPSTDQQAVVGSAFKDAQVALASTLLKRYDT